MNDQARKVFQCQRRVTVAVILQVNKGTEDLIDLEDTMTLLKLSS